MGTDRSQFQFAWASSVGISDRFLPLRVVPIFWQEVLNFGLGTFKFVCSGVLWYNHPRWFVRVRFGFLLCVFEVPFPQAEE